jgi:HAMP domain-containing protein
MMIRDSDRCFMGRILACPFCRELTPEGEATRCETCEVELVPMEKLPPSAEVLAEEAALEQATPPELRRLPWHYPGRGRGLLIALALAGLVAFFSPWVRITQPTDVTLTGFDLARGQAGWLWGGAVGWFLNVPLVASLRSLVDLRGVRVICAAFALMTLGETALLLGLPPEQSPYVRTEYGYAWGLYASLVLGVLGTVTAARLGGRLDDLRDLSHVVGPRETSDGYPVH